MAAQLPLKSWHEAIGEPALADATWDRPVHGAHQTASGRRPRADTRGAVGRGEPPRTSGARGPSSARRARPPGA
jgi:hypothetical protein